MASLLRQIVAGPRAKHAETGLDLCYVTPNIIATSGPSQSYPQRAYRNPLDRLVAFLDARHGDNWAIWEFRAEGTGYPDDAVHHRIRHYPWPDHHPPPFRLVPLILASMRQWLGDAGDGEGGEDKAADGKGNSTDADASADAAAAASPDKRVVVVHCKAGKGRSGTMACSYLVAVCGWSVPQALDRFTARRMRPRFGSGVTIPSQLRWLDYVDRWVDGGSGGGAGANATSGSARLTAPLPTYRDRPVEIVEIRVWGLRHGVKLAVEGYVDEGRRIRVFHIFQNDERFIVEGNAPGGGGLLDLVADMASPATTPPPNSRDDRPTKTSGSPSSPGPSPLHSTDTTLPPLKGQSDGTPPPQDDVTPSSFPLSSTASSASTSAASGTPPPPPPPQQQPSFRFAALDEPGGQAVLFRPKTPVRVPTSDVNIALERRNRTAAGLLGGAGLTMVTAVAHVWFNAFFEGRGPEQGGQPDSSGVFAIDWDRLDGIKGSSQKGSRAAERIEVVWRVVEEEAEAEADKATGVSPSSAPMEVPQMLPANWKGDNGEDPEADTRLGLRREDPASAAISRASSVKEWAAGGSGEYAADKEDTDADALAGVKMSGPSGGDLDAVALAATASSSSASPRPAP